jgi:hypothetical protein
MKNVELQYLDVLIGPRATLLHNVLTIKDYKLTSLAAYTSQVQEPFKTSRLLPLETATDVNKRFYVIFNSFLI